jgi:HEAT repeat protein
VTEEIESLWDEAKLNQKKLLALGQLSEPEVVQPIVKAVDTSTLKLDSPDWHERFQAVQQLDASNDTLPHFIMALRDEKPQIRRWAAAKLAGVKSVESVEALSQALLNDSNVGVRRTAGDSLSDIGDITAQPAICQALSDPNKLVRWRAARFLAETGTEAALPYLENAKGDSEYEVRLEVEAAMNHITEGSKAALPVWKLMAQDNE